MQCWLSFCNEVAFPAITQPLFLKRFYQFDQLVLDLLVELTKLAMLIAQNIKYY
jgi:hypothetical protein